MTFTLDWISNWRVILNLGLNVLASGAVGSLLVWFVSPPEIGFFSRTILAAGFVPALSSLVAKLQVSPEEQQARAHTRKIQAGTVRGRRASDPPSPPPPP